MIHDDTGSVWVNTCWYLVELDQYRVVMVDSWWYWGSMEWYWLICDGTRSLWGDTCWYLVLLGQYGVVLGGTGSVLGGSG